MALKWRSNHRPEDVFREFCLLLPLYNKSHVDHELLRRILAHFEDLSRDVARSDVNTNLQIIIAWLNQR